MASNPLATPFEYQPVNAIASNTLTFGAGGGAASRAAFAGTTPHAYFAGSTVAAVMLVEDFNASFPIKFDEQVVSNVANVRIPASGSFPTGYRNIEISYRLRDNSAVNGMDTIGIQMNGDTATNYFWNQLSGNSAAASDTEASGVASAIAGLLTRGGAAAGNYASGWIRIMDYNSTVQVKKAKWESEGTIAVTTTNLFVRSGLAGWNNTAALTSVLLLGTAGSNVTGVVVTYLYP